MAQCEYRDLELMVKQRGIESSLEYLQRAGVYLSFEEFKEGAEVQRAGRVIPVQPDQFDRPAAAGRIPVRSGGTRSRGLWISITLDHLATAYAPQLASFLDSVGGANTPIVTWQLGFPSGAGMIVWLALAKLRRPAVRWFSLTPAPRIIRPHQLAFRLARIIAQRAGIRTPQPEYAPVQHAPRVLDAVMPALRTAGVCIVITTPSCAVRLAAEARRRGVSLQGVHFLTSGEPLTPGKAEEITQTGGRAACHYAVTEAGGSVGAPCGNPIDPDEVHLRSDALVMITRPRRFGDMDVNAIMLTSLLPSAPMPLLNVEMDDFAETSRRPCICVWGRLGLETHLVRIRSFSKLTGEGTTLLGTNCVQIVEHTLPHAFGGTSVDYQLVEAEDEDRLTRLYLLVSPKVGPVDETEVLRRFTHALADTSGRPLGGTRPIWTQARSIRVIRRDPLITETGKLLPFRTLGASERRALT